MCAKTPKIQPQAPPAPPPAPPMTPPTPPAFGGENADTAAQNTKRRGRSSLRIEASSGGSGLNIPQ